MALLPKKTLATKMATTMEGSNADAALQSKVCFSWPIYQTVTDIMQLSLSLMERGVGRREIDGVMQLKTRLLA